MTSSIRAFVVVAAMAAAVNVTSSPVHACPQFEGPGLYLAENKTTIFPTEELRFAFEPSLNGVTVLFVTSDGTEISTAFSIDAPNVALPSMAMVVGTTAVIQSRDEFCGSECDQSIGPLTVVEAPTTLPPTPEIVLGRTFTFENDQTHQCHSDNGFFNDIDETTVFVTIEYENDEDTLVGLRPVLSLKRRDEDQGVTVVVREAPPVMEISSGVGTMVKLGTFTGEREYEVEAFFVDLAGQAGPTTTERISVRAPLPPGGCQGFAVDNGSQTPRAALLLFAFTLWRGRRRR